jgi:2-polyprenyl-6-methoxyphenol hydroxylase-like FAD-dependent oxidoreductase
MLPTLGLGANLALRDAARLLDQLSAARGEAPLTGAIGAYEQDMRDDVDAWLSQHNDVIAGMHSHLRGLRENPSVR